MSDLARVVLCTCPDNETAAALADAIVAAERAACVNIVAGLTSVYRWRGEVKHDPEVLLVIKCHADQVDELSGFIAAKHPYEVTECIALPVVDGLPDYLAWIARGGD